MTPSCDYCKAELYGRTVFLCCTLTLCSFCYQDHLGVAHPPFQPEEEDE